MAFFNQNAAVILRLGNRFHKAHNQAARLLREREVIAFDTIHGMFCQWDVDYDLVARPKSDLVCRAVARTFRWHMPRGRFFGWDFKPLPEGFVAPARMGLEELAERVKGQIGNSGRIGACPYERGPACDAPDGTRHRRPSLDA